MPNYYELLNAQTTATFDELKRNYKQLILQCHPDKLQQKEEPEVTAIAVNATSASDPNFNAISKAWNTLKDPIKRKLYDAELLQTKFQTHSNIYASIKLNDMQRIQVNLEEMDEEQHRQQPPADNADKESTTTASHAAYAYDCRCGGQYVLDGGGNSDESADVLEPASEVIVECSECSLVVIVKT